MLYFTPGPSQTYPTVKQHVLNALDEDILSITHRSALYNELHTSAVDNLKKLLSIPKDNYVFFLASSTEAMERIVQNTVEEKSFHFINGAFGKRFYTTALELKKLPESVEVAPGHAFDFNAIHVPDDAELLSFTHNESSTGVQLDMNDLYSLRKKHPEKLFSLDIVSSAPYVDVKYDLMDLVFFSVQKGIGLPAGLGILIATPKAIEKALYLQKKGANIGSYHNFPSLKEYADKNQTLETPNILDIYLLSKVTKDMLEKGIAAIRKETDEKAALLYAHMSKSDRFDLFVQDTRYQSRTVIVAGVKGGSKSLIKDLQDKGFAIGSGYNELKETHIRIANFPAHTMENVQSLLSNL